MVRIRASPDASARRRRHDRGMSTAHGAVLTFEILPPSNGIPPSLRVRGGHETLLRVIDGAVRLRVNGTERVLTEEAEARIPAGARHTITSAGDTEARIVQHLRAVEDSP
jgi:mannose-6-phosphate isomerase-like protein (cupin superfamily)